MYYDRFKKQEDIPYHPPKDPVYDLPLCSESIRALFTDCTDFEERELWIGGKKDFPVWLFFIDGLVSGSEVAENVVRPLTDVRRMGGVRDEEQAREKILAGLVYGAACSPCTTTDEAVTALVNGFCLFVFDGLQTAVSFEVRTSNHRGIEEPRSEQALKGARDSFVETIRINTSLVRRHLRSPALKTLPTTVGRKSNTRAEIVYMDGVADPAIVEKLRSRLDSIDMDGVITTTALETYISDSHRSPFPQLMITERPDRFCLNLLEGRVGLLVDGLPLGWMMPATLSQNLRVPDDISKHFAVASALTLLRHIALFITLLLPAVYVAIAMYHQEMFPIRLLLSVIESKQAVPFSTAIEVLSMLIAFELLQEAGLRLPSSIGETISIIGALIVGQSAVEAKVISPIAVIVVATAGIAGYTIPNQDLAQALRMTRFALVLTAIFAGLFGIVAGCILLVWHLCSLDSFGQAYIDLASERDDGSLLRALTQPPIRRQKLRDEKLRTPDRRRQK